MTPFDPSPFVLGVTLTFALATLATGVLALAKVGHAFLVDTRRFQRAGTSDVVRAPNVLDRRFWAAIPYVVIMIPTVTALVLVF